MEDEEKPEEDEDVADEATSELDRAEKINKEKLNILDREEKLLERKERLEAVRMVGGKSEAGIQPPKKEEESPEDYAASLLDWKDERKE